MLWVSVGFIKNFLMSSGDINGLAHGLEKMGDWLRVNKLRVNPKKTGGIRINPGR